MKYFKKLVGKRVYLSPINPDDAEIYTKWMNDLKISIPLGNASSLYSLPKEKEVLEELANEGYNFAIVELTTDRLLGNCSLFELDLIHRRAQLGIFLGEKEDWGKGFGTEAIQLLLEFGFKIIGLHNIMLKVFSFNKRAIEVYRKIGFTEIGRRTQSFQINNQWFDELYFQILSTEFKSTYLDDWLPE
ncbi:MAG: GNAT family N-acetyltransferase [Firmicutes bacterium]|nr:GNAT family N-acetyltransferase [Bacillota bacterium]